MQEQLILIFKNQKSNEILGYNKKIYGMVTSVLEAEYKKIVLGIKPEVKKEAKQERKRTKKEEKVEKFFNDDEWQK